MSNRPSRSGAGSRKNLADFDFDDSGERRLAELDDSGSDYEDELRKMQGSKSNVVVKKVIKPTKKGQKKPKVEKPKKVKTPKVKKVQKKPSDDIDYDQLWKCLICKYENENDQISCAVCETARPSKAAEPTPAIDSMASTATASSSKFAPPFLKTTAPCVLNICGSFNYTISSDTGTESLAELKAEICDIEKREDVFLFVAGKPVVDYEMLVSSIGQSQITVIVPLGGKVQESSASTGKVKGQTPKVKNNKVKKVQNNENKDNDNGQPWECSHCTFTNENEKKICVACRTARPSKAAQPTPAIAPMASTSHAITGASLFDQEMTDLESSFDDETIVMTPNQSKKFKKVAQKSKIVIHDETIESDENKENAVPSKSGKYLCNDCGKRFTTREHLVTHVNTVHEGKKPYKCEHCEVDYFAKFFLLISWISVYISRKHFRCHRFRLQNCFYFILIVYFYL